MAKHGILAEEHPELLDEWDFEKNKNICSPYEVTSGSGREVWWKCMHNHSWKTQIRNRTCGKSCPICNKFGGQSFPEQAVVYYISQVFKSTTTQFSPEWLNNMRLDLYIPEIHTAIEYDGYYYHKDRVNRDIYKNELCKNNNITLIRIRENGLSKLKNCINILIKHSLDDSLHELFKLLKCDIPDIDTTRDRLLIRKSYYYLTSIVNSIANKYPEKLLEWDYNMNEGIDPHTVSYKSFDKFYWICPICNQSYLQTPYNRIVKDYSCPNKGCKQYKNNSTRSKKNNFQELFPKIAEEWNFNKNDDMEPKDISYKSHKKVWWIGDCGHEWQASIKARVNGRKCPYCFGQRCLTGFNDLRTLYPELIKEWDYDKNNISPDTVTYGSGKVVLWICTTCGNEFKMSIKNRTLQEQCCPKCGRERVRHKLGKAVRNIETGHVYYSTGDAGRKTGISQGNIYSCANGKRETAGGYHWEFVKEDEKEK